MKVAVVTPYHQADDPRLQDCLRSVDAQSHGNCVHVLVGDGPACTPADAGDRRLHLGLSHNIGDYGDSPRSLGAIYAFALGADAVAFLDADNWFDADHIASLVALQRATGAPVVTSRRKLVGLDGEVMGVCDDSNGLTFCDTNCLFFTHDAAELATSWWRIPARLHAIDDRVIWARVLRSGCAIARTLQPTSNYRTAFRFHYERYRRPVPRAVKPADDIRALDREIADYLAEAGALLAGYETLLDGRFLRPRSAV